jgi:hypothetical protein
MLIKTINELETGDLSDDGNAFLKSMDRPIPNEESSVHLFARNLEVDVYTITIFSTGSNVVKFSLEILTKTGFSFIKKLTSMESVSNCLTTPRSPFTKVSLKLRISITGQFIFNPKFF